MISIYFKKVFKYTNVNSINSCFMTAISQLCLPIEKFNVFFKF